MNRATPDGEWHERGRMGWWAMVFGEKESDDWRTEAADLMARHADALVVLVDCHI